METNSSSSIEIGSLSANIAGDTRYTDTLRVLYFPATKMVQVTVHESSAVSGNDGPGGSTGASLSFLEEVSDVPKNVLAVLKQVISKKRFNFKQYGKPTKNFRWVYNEDGSGGTTYGLSLAIVKDAIAYAKS